MIDSTIRDEEQIHRELRLKPSWHSRSLSENWPPFWARVHPRVSRRGLGARRLLDVLAHRGPDVGHNFRRPRAHNLSAWPRE